MKTELWKKHQARSSFRPDPQQLSATCQMFRHDANVRENKSVAGSRSLLGRHAAPRSSAPREEGMELRGGHGCFLLPAIVPPGSPSLTLATCYFCSKVLSGVNTSPLALGTFLCTSPCQGRGPAPTAGAQPRVRASTRPRGSPAGDRIWGGQVWGGQVWGGYSRAAMQRPGRARSWQGGHMGLQHRGHSGRSAARVPTATSRPFAAAAPTSCLCCCSSSSPCAVLVLVCGTSSAHGDPGHPRQDRPAHSEPHRTHTDSCMLPRGCPGTGRRFRLG